MFFVLILTVLILGVCGATESDYQRGFADGYEAGLAACFANLTSDQYDSILAALEEIKSMLDVQKDESVPVDGTRTTKVYSLVREV